MKRHRHSPEQVVRKLREAERLPNDGRHLTEVLRTLEVSEAYPSSTTSAARPGS
jgi:hypothetical protein